MGRTHIQWGNGCGAYCKYGCGDHLLIPLYYWSTEIFTTGPLRLGLGLIGIAWQKKVYHDQFANGIESSVVSSSFVRLREWYPMMTASYRVWKWNHLDIALYVGLNSRGFKTSETAWWDAQVGVSVTAPWKSR